MDKPKAPTDIFDRPLLQTRRDRAARRKQSFFTQRCAADAADRLCDINRRFDRALIIAPDDFSKPFLAALPPDKVPVQVEYCYAAGASRGLDGLSPQHPLPYERGSFDLIISILDLHSVNDLPGSLVVLKQLLKPDGLFIGSLFGGRTLTELRQVLYAVDNTVLDGITPRIFPFGDYSQMAALLQRTGFALPVIDTDRLNITYKELSTLISDLRDLGDTNCLLSRRKHPITKQYLKNMEDVYAEMFFENAKYLATFEILWLTGWSPHESQQQPLKPGSAKMRLADALGKTEQKL